MDNQPNTQNASSSLVNGWYKASVLRRYFAILIDGLILIPAYLISAFVITKLFGETVGSLANFVIGPLYGVFFIWKYGATLGKKWLGIKVVNTQYESVSFGQAFLRETIGKFLSSIVFSLGYLWALWDKDKQAWHDKIAKTYVVTKIPNSGRESPWLFILAVLFLVIPILAAIVVLVINPLELTRRGRDAARFSDLANIQQAINVTVQSASDSKILCYQSQSPCEGRSNSADPNATKLDGSGWVKTNLSIQASVPIHSLPVDPVNSGTFYYRYCSDGINWEIDITLESEKQKVKATTDGGDDPNVYEIGSNLSLCK